MLNKMFSTVGWVKPEELKDSISKNQSANLWTTKYPDLSDAIELFKMEEPVIASIDLEDTCMRLRDKIFIDSGYSIGLEVYSSPSRTGMFVYDTENTSQIWDPFSQTDANRLIDAFDFDIILDHDNVIVSHKDTTVKFARNCEFVKLRSPNSHAIRKAVAVVSASLGEKARSEDGSKRSNALKAAQKIGLKAGTSHERLGDSGVGVYIHRAGESTGQIWDPYGRTDDALEIASALNLAVSVSNGSVIVKQSDHASALIDVKIVSNAKETIREALILYAVKIAKD